MGEYYLITVLCFGKPIWSAESVTIKAKDKGNSLLTHCLYMHLSAEECWNFPNFKYKCISLFKVFVTFSTWL